MQVLESVTGTEVSVGCCTQFLSSAPAPGATLLKGYLRQRGTREEGRSGGTRLGEDGELGKGSAEGSRALRTSRRALTARAQPHGGGDV